MGRTMAEKILSAHSGCEARAGDLVIAELDYVMAGDAKGPKAVDIFREAGFAFRLDPAKTDFVIDHFVPAQDVLWANHHRKLRIFGAEYGVKVFEPGAGVCHTVVTEEGRVGPGALAVGGDSHVCTYGALGAMGVAVESVEIASAYATGKLWFKTPESVRVEFTGALARGVFSKDMELVLAREMGGNGANYMAVEYGGEALADLSMDARFTIANMSVDMGAKTGIMEVDDKALEWARARGAPVEGAVAPDPDAVYARRIDLDVSSLTPVVAAPPATGNAHPVEDYAGLPVQQAFVGTCTNGRLEDLEIAAKVVRGKKTAPGVRFYVAPTSKRIYEAALASGAIGALAEAGAAVLTAACGPCASMTGNGCLADGERAISSANRNFPGRLGSKEAEIFLGSPATVAASALTGRITDPREFL